MRAFHLQVMEAEFLRLSGLFCVLPAAIKLEKPAPAHVPGQEDSGQTKGGSGQRPRRGCRWPLPAPPSTGPAFAACRDRPGRGQLRLEAEEEAGRAGSLSHSLRKGPLWACALGRVLRRMQWEGCVQEESRWPWELRRTH